MKNYKEEDIAYILFITALITGLLLILIAIAWLVIVDIKRNNTTNEYDYCMTYKESTRVPTKCIKYFTK